MNHVARYFYVFFGLALFAAAQDLPTLHDKTSSSAPAARETDTPTVQVEVKEVTLPVTVRDKKNKLVENLTKDDFDLVQDGKTQTITNLRHETNLPLTFGLLVDTSMSMRGALDKEKSASHKFIDDEMTQPKDQGFVIHFDHEVELLQDLTASRDKLYNALGLLETAHTSQDTSSDDDSRGRGGHHHGGTQLYDAIYLASNEILNKQEGRKAIVVITDGEDRGSKETLSDAVEAAQRADTIVYAIYMKGEEENRGFGNGGRGGPRIGFPGGGGGYPGGGGGYPGGGRRGGEEREMKVDGKKILTELATKTGGQMFEAKKDNLESVYAQITEELRNQMILAYTPDKSSAEVGYHRVTLTAKNKDLKVQTREGYYIPEPTASTPK